MTYGEEHYISPAWSEEFIKEIIERQSSLLTGWFRGDDGRYNGGIIIM